MESEKVTVDLSRLCRTCNTERSHMRPLCTRDSDIGCRLDEMLMSCTNLKIREANGFPNSICDCCVAELISAYRFKQRCEIVDQYYKSLRLESNSDCIDTPMVYDKRSNYDYVEVLEDNSVVFRCWECCRTFNTIRGLKDHKPMHTKNAIIKIKQESCSVTEPVVFMEGKHEEGRLLELKQEQENDGEGEGNSNGSFFKKSSSSNSEGNYEMFWIPIESKGKQEESSTILPEPGLLQIKEEQENDGNEVNSSNLYFKQSNETVTKGRSEMIAIPTASREQHEDTLTVVEFIPLTEGKIEEEEHRLELTKGTYANHGNNVTESSSSNVLKDHSLLHTGTHDSRHRRFNCNVCEKSFTRNRHLEEHKRVHSVNKLLKCNICDKPFAYTRSLRRHKLTHSAGKRFKCDVCDKSYAYSHGLQAHKRKHSVNGRFKCEICKKSYKHSNNLRAHEQTHSINNRFKCDVCGKAYKYSSYLQRHKPTHDKQTKHMLQM